MKRAEEEKPQPAREGKGDANGRQVQWLVRNFKFKEAQLARHHRPN